MTILQVRCPGTEKWIDERDRRGANEQKRVRCPSCACRVPMAPDGRLVKHDIEVEVRR
jgi:hypothetical protein